MPAAPSGFATFWAGANFSAYEAACLSSFTLHGCALTVYGYEPAGPLPPGVAFRPAEEIVERHFMNAYLIKGKPSLSHFSDLFRYRLFSKTSQVWVDSDLYLLRPFPFVLPATLLAREDTAALCGAIMRIDQDDPALASLIARTEAAAGRDLVWGETGPRLLNRVFGQAALSAGAYGPELFFPIHYDQFWKVFLPEYREECEALAAEGITLHLWNNIVDKVGIWKDVLPPHGSYLERRFTADGMGHLFKDTFPASAMRHIIDNYRMRMSGGFGDVKQLARFASSGIKRRFGRKIASLRQGFRGAA